MPCESLRQAVLERKDELIRLVSDLIRINSENPGGSQAEIVAFAQKTLAGMGIPSQLVGPNPDHPSVVAQFGDPSGFNLLLNGHLDVVPAGDRAGWKFDPFGGEITETRIRGRGTSDMKAGVACALFALKLLVESQKPMRGVVRVHLVTDEETGGEFGTKWLCENGYAAGGHGCLVAEPTSFNNIEIGQKGQLLITLRAAGTPAHGSLGNYVGSNAILTLSKVLPRLGELTAIPGRFAPDQAEALANSRIIASHIGVPGVENVIDHVTANVGIIRGGTKVNMVPDACEAQVDCRLPVGVDHAAIERAVARILKEEGVADRVSADFKWRGEANTTDIGADIVRRLRGHAERIWGSEILPAYQWASSDAKYYRLEGVPTIQYGPANLEGIHGYNEDVDIEDVVHAAEIYMLTFTDLLGIE